MAIPDFQSIMLPLLNFCADGQEHTNREAIDTLAEQFGLTEDEQKQLLPSGRQCVFVNRVAWARAHMKMAILLENIQRGVFRIADRGKEVLAQSPSKISLRFLRQFPEYIEARDKHKTNQDQSESVDDEAKTPEEQLEQAYEILRENLASELLSQLKSASPAFFEKVVVEVLVKMGYGGSRKDAGQAIGRSAAITDVPFLSDSFPYHVNVR